MENIVKKQRLDKALKIMDKADEKYAQANQLPRKNYRLKKELCTQANELYEKAHKILNAASKQ